MFSSKINNEGSAQNLKIKNMSLYEKDYRNKTKSISKLTGHNDSQEKAVQITNNNEVPYESKMSRSQLRHNSKESFSKIENTIMPLMKKLSENNKLIRRATTQNKKTRSNFKSGINPYKKLMETQLSNYETVDKLNEKKLETVVTEGTSITYISIYIFLLVLFSK